MYADARSNRSKGNLNNPTRGQIALAFCLLAGVVPLAISGSKPSDPAISILDIPTLLTDILLFFGIAATLVVLVFQLVWNHLLGPLFWMPKIDYGQALCLSTFVWLLFA